MNLIIETDIGHDPDDFFALCYLHSAGVNIKAILVCPGDPDQIAIARFFCKEVGLDIPIGASKLDRTKLSSGTIHHYLLDKYGYSKEAKPDGLGVDILRQVHTADDDQLFIIGPAASLGAYLKKYPSASFGRSTMQGGFLPYSAHDHECVKYDKFVGKAWVPTFNMNGDRPGALAFINGARIPNRQFVGKNVCHTVLYGIQQLENMATPKDRAGELFIEGMVNYLEHHDVKKFHDPTAACCHLHPEIGTWVRGKPCKMESGWSTEVRDDGDNVLAAIDYDKLWENICNWR
jgi:pyrimidine-specific ribonucleoside hydrolase